MLDEGELAVKGHGIIYLKANIIFESIKNLLWGKSPENAEQTGHCFGLIATKIMCESLDRFIEDLYVY